jgi:beta-glucosidase
MKTRVQELLKQLTLEEKASLTSGGDFWNTKAIERLGIPAIALNDGPHGVRRQAGKSDHLGINDSLPATCFPTASATASSWDADLLEEVGVALGQEAQALGANILLGPGLNIKRSPLCGRNFEYFSEDPFVAGKLASAMTKGVESQGVGTSMKHFVANNQETRRLVSNSVIDERALREIYLAGFEEVVKKAQPATVMCSYNLLNGEYVSESARLQNKILRDEWGYQGVVVSDWGACNDRVLGLKNGQDLEMPTSFGYNDRLVVEAVKNGTLDEADLDKAAARLIEMALTYSESHQEGATFDQDVHHTLARRVAASSAVLLKNDDGILPISSAPCQSIAIIGEFAKVPRYQGSGSSRINPTRLDGAWDYFEASDLDVRYAPGYVLDGTDARHPELEAEAAHLAENADLAIVFVGLTDEYESEGFDRDTLAMPESHNALVAEVVKANPNTIVVLHGGSPMTMPWRDDVKAILMSYLGGQAVGGAQFDLLTGAVNPSGKLAETYPLALVDNPSHGHFGHEDQWSEYYTESIYVGYRWYQTAEVPVLYPFGYGLSYTSFDYSNLEVLEEEGAYKVRVTVTNTGQVQGQEVVQVYVAGPSDSKIFRAEQELKGFVKVALAPGQSQVVDVQLENRAFSYYNTAVSDWAIEAGQYEIRVGASSEDIRLTTEVTLTGDGQESVLADGYANLEAYMTPKRSTHADVTFGASNAEFAKLFGRDLPGLQRGNKQFDLNSTLNDIKHTLAGRAIYKFVMAQLEKEMAKTPKEAQAMARRSIMTMPMRSYLMTGSGLLNPSQLQGLVDLTNRKPISGIKNLLKK